jgi:hypothetical protein
MARAKRKPTDPQDMATIAERRAERARSAEEIKRLTREDDVTVNVDERTGQLVGAWRRDVVSMMRDAGKITDEVAGYVRGLEGLIAEANGRSASCLSILDRVSGGPVGDHAIVQHIEAARALNKRQMGMDRVTWGLLRELCDGNLLISRWRGVVERRTGEKGERAQGAIIRQAFRALASVEESIFVKGVAGRGAA